MTATEGDREERNIGKIVWFCVCPLQPLFPSVHNNAVAPDQFRKGFGSYNATIQPSQVMRLTCHGLRKSTTAWLSYHHRMIDCVDGQGPYHFCGMHAATMMELQVLNNVGMCRHTESTVLTSVCKVQLCVPVSSRSASVD